MKGRDLDDVAGNRGSKGRFLTTGGGSLKRAAEKIVQIRNFAIAARLNSATIASEIFSLALAAEK